MKTPSNYCETCHGIGRVRVESSGVLVLGSYEVCTDCDGQGFISKDSPEALQARLKQIASENHVQRLWTP